MPDSKITALTALTAADPAVDMFPVVDVSDTTMAASGTTKRISINNILACSPTATLASATITGDLTVDTSTLKVDSANDRVGIQSTILNSRLTVRAGTLAGIDIYRDDANANFSGIRFKGTTNSTVNGQIGWSGTQLRIEGTDEILCATNSSDRFRISSSGVFTFENVGGVAGTAMTLNATGLGVGASPAQKLTVAGSAEITGGVVGQGALIGRDGSSGGANYGANTGNTSLNAPASGTLRFNVNNGTFAGQFDTSGNLILSSVATPPTLTINGQLVANATSNTNLRFSYRGSDGITRVANLTLA